MAYFKIGTLPDWFGVGLMEGIATSQRIGAEGVQIYALGELDPAKVTPDDVRRVMKQAADCKQEISALCAELGGHGFSLEADHSDRIDYIKSVVRLAIEMNCNIITTHIGRVPEDKNDTIYKIMLDACSELGAYAESQGAKIAIETGPEPVQALVDFIKDCGDKGLAINYDPANLAMSLNDVPEKGVVAGANYIIHTHAKDGRNLKPPDEAYRNRGVTIDPMAADGGKRESTYAIETPLGEGDVNWPAYLGALRDIGFRGFLAIEREVKGDTTTDEIAHGVKFLREVMEKL